MKRAATAAAGERYAGSRVKSETSYGGAVSGYFTGGLNFQVEHHLFPRMSHRRGTFIAKIREVCKTRCQVRLLPVDSSKFRLSRTEPGRYRYALETNLLCPEICKTTCK
jgi:fatty acid desaturase